MNNIIASASRFWERNKYIILAEFGILALAVCACIWSGIPSLHGFVLLGILAVCEICFFIGYSLYRRSRRAAVTGLIIGSLLCLSFPQKAKARPDGDDGKSVGGVICGILVIGCGVVIILGIKKMCQSIPPTTPPPPTEPPPPPPWIGNTNIINPSYPPYYVTNGVVVTNIVVHPKVKLAMSDGQGMAYYDASGKGWVNPDGSPVKTLIKSTIETATSIESWHKLYDVSVYASTTGSTVVYRDANGNIVCSGFTPVTGGSWGQGAAIPLAEPGAEEGNERFYRLRSDF